MKLTEWAEKAGVKYLTAYRWFKAGTMPVKTYQTESGTILVEDEDIGIDPNIKQNQANDATALFFKKTVEYSANKSPIEDFAAYVFSTFNLSIKQSELSPKYSKNKPKSEDIQNHFKRFLPVQGKKPEPNMYIPDPETLETITSKEEASITADNASPIISDEVKNLQSNYSTLLSVGGSSFERNSSNATFNVASLDASIGILSNGGSFCSAEVTQPLATGFIKYGDQLNNEFSGNINLAQENNRLFYTNHVTPLDIEKPRRGRPKKVRG